MLEQALHGKTVWLFVFFLWIVNKTYLKKRFSAGSF